PLRCRDTAARLHELRQSRTKSELSHRNQHAHLHLRLPHPELLDLQPTGLASALSLSRCNGLCPHSLSLLRSHCWMAQPPKGSLFPAGYPQTYRHSRAHCRGRKCYCAVTPLNYDCYTAPSMFLQYRNSCFPTAAEIGAAAI